MQRSGNGNGYPGLVEAVDAGSRNGWTLPLCLVIATLQYLVLVQANRGRKVE